MKEELGAALAAVAAPDSRVNIFVCANEQYHFQSPNLMTEKCSIDKLAIDGAIVGPGIAGHSRRALPRGS